MGSQLLARTRLQCQRSCCEVLQRSSRWMPIRARPLPKLKALKKSAVDALQGLGVGKDSIKISASKILEWDTTPRQMNLFYQDSFALSPAIEASEYTAVAFVSFDVPVAGKDSDELSLLPYDICKRLRAQAPFESSKIDMFYVGELTEAVDQ